MTMYGALLGAEHHDDFPGGIHANDESDVGEVDELFARNAPFHAGACADEGIDETPEDLINPEPRNERRGIEGICVVRLRGMNHLIGSSELDRADLGPDDLAPGEEHHVQVFVARERAERVADFHLDLGGDLGGEPGNGRGRIRESPNRRFDEIPVVLARPIRELGGEEGPDGASGPVVIEHENSGVETWWRIASFYISE